MSRMTHLAPALILTAILATGCGGSSGTPSRNHFVAQADPICKQIAERRAAANAALNKARGTTVEQLEVLTQVAPSIAADEDQAIARLRKLKAPGALAHSWQEMLTGMQKLANDDLRLHLDAKANNFKAVQSVIASGDKVRERITAIATSAGFAYCGRTS
jgi:hypothetical protein